MSHAELTPIAQARSLLFVPGNRPERFAKAAAAQADLVIIDLEDAVNPAEKTVARRNTREWFNVGNTAVVRVNAHGTPWHEDDLELATDIGAPVMLPKSESPDTVREAIERTGTGAIALVETATGILSSPAIAQVAGVERLAFGSIDLAAQLGIDPENRDALLAGRLALVLASAAAGLTPPIDGVTTAIADSDRLRDDLRYAKGLGMSAKLCIHPSQVAVVHHAAAPTAEELVWAQQVVDGAGATDGAPAAVNGHMIDLPVLTRAQQVLWAARSRP